MLSSLQNERKRMRKGRRASLAKNTSGEEVIRIEFPYDDLLLYSIREIPGRVYHKDQHCWSAPMYPETVDRLKELGFEIDVVLQERSEMEKARRANLPTMEIPGLKGTPFHFQSQGVTFIDSKGGRALIADEMGLGKTIQALAWLQLYPENRPAVVVVPASLKLNWEREAQKWLENPDTEVLYGTQVLETEGGILIINYDILAHWTGELRRRSPKVIIMDEAHYIKNSNAQRTKACRILCRGVPHVIGLTGTPIESRPAEIYNIATIIKPDLFPNKWWFLQRYCNAHHNGWGWNFNGASNTKELHSVLTGTIMIRRRKSEVLKELPDKIRTFVPLPLANRREYYFAEQDFITWVRETKGVEAARKARNAQAFTAIEGLKQLAIKGKMESVIEWVEDFLESDQKLILFCTHKFVMDTIMEKFAKVAVRVDGGVTGANRQKAVDDFQTKEEVRLFVGNIQAAGVGITLTAASNVAFIELPWTPGALTQAEDRAHRIGQKDTVNVYYLLAARTIEERIANLIDEKRKIVTTVLDGKDVEQEALLTQLMYEYSLITPETK